MKKHEQQKIFYRSLNVTNFRDKWIEVSTEVKHEWEKYTWKTRKAKQRSGECKIPYHLDYLCDAFCDDCKFKCGKNVQSLEVSIEEEMDLICEGKSSFAGFISDKALTATIDEDAFLLKMEMVKLKEANPQGYQILMLFASGYSERECAEIMGLPRNTYVYKRDALIKSLREKLG